MYIRLVNEFQNYLCDVKNRSEKTIDAYTRDIYEFFSIMDGNNITQDNVERIYIKRLILNGNSASSRARKLSSVRSYYTWAMKKKKVKENPVADIEMPKIPKKEIKVMSNDEVKKVLACCEDTRDKAMLILMFGTGLRREEVTEVKISDLDLMDNSLVVHGKGDKERIVYYSNDVRDVIIKHLNEKTNNSEYLFASVQYGKKLSTVSINKIVNKYFTMAGVKEKGFTAHSTRKAFATQLYNQTNDIEVVQKLLGHSNPTVTMRYVSVSEKHKKNAIANFTY